MTNPKHTDTSRSGDLVEQRYLLMKRGLYYAPDRQGYTGVKARAGRYREVEALGLDGVTAIHEDEAEDFSPACWEDTKIAVLTDRIEALEAALRDLVEAVQRRTADLGGYDGRFGLNKSIAKARAALGEKQ